MDTQTNMPVTQPVAQNQVNSFVFPTAGKLFAQAQEIYKTKFNSLIIISLCSAGAMAVSNLFSVNGPIYLKISSDPARLSWIVLSVLISLFAIFISFWAFGATIHNITSIEASTSAGKSFTESSHFIMPLIFTGLLVFLIIFGGLILFIIPGIIFAFWYGQSAYVVITENLSGKKALDRSKFYAKGNIGQIFKKGFFIGIISVLIGLATGLVCELLSKTFHLTFMPAIGNIIFQLFWTPLVSIYAFLLFQYLRQSKASTAPLQ